MRNSRKDILFLCQFFYPEYNSSATLPFDTAKYLASRGFGVGALCGYPKEYSNDENVPLMEIVDGVEIKRIKYTQLKRSSKIGRLINYFSFTFRAWLNKSYLKDYKCVIVYSNPPILPYVPVIAKKKYGTKFIFVAYDVYPEVAYASQSLTPDSMISKVMNKLNHRLYQSVDHVVSLTDEMKEFLRSNRLELDEKRISTIANWAHEKELLPSLEAYERFGYSNKQFVVSYFGNMGICQDVQTMLDAAALLKENEKIKFLIVGHGNKKPFVEQFIGDNNLKNVQIYDFMTGKDFEQAVAISSCSIVSLEKGLMGTCAPSKYYSYLQGGQPVLAIVEEGSYLAKEVETQQIGHAVKIGDAVGLKSVIEELARNPEIAKEMGKRAKLLYKNEYDYEVAMKKYFNVIQGLIK